MKMSQIKEKAKDLGIDPGKMKKEELIRNIQTREGNESCFNMKSGLCIYDNCCWKDDCKSVF